MNSPLRRCFNCWYWKDPSTEPGVVHIIRPCVHPSVNGLNRRTVDGLQSDSPITTSPEFGCVHFTHKHEEHQNSSRG